MTQVQPTSEQQFDALMSGVLPAVEEVRPGLYAIALDMPGMRPPYAFCYAALSVGSSLAVHLIDAGLDSDVNWAALGEALAGFDREIADIASVTITHLHPDHTGLAWRVREASGAVVRMHEFDAHSFGESTITEPADDLMQALLRWGVPEPVREELVELMGGPAPWGGSHPIDEVVTDGATFEFGRFAATVIHTPGHTGGHICIAIEAAGDGNPAMVFTGDHVLPGINPGIALGGMESDDPLGDYFASLEKLEPYADAEVLPGHGYRFTTLGERSAEIRAHHDIRTNEVAAVLAKTPELSVYEIAQQITWSSGWENLKGFLTLSALAQVEMHVARVHATTV